MRDNADVATHVVRHFAAVVAHDTQRTGRRSQERRQDGNERGLAGAVRPKHSQALVAGQSEGHLVQSNLGSVMFGEALGFEGRARFSSASVTRHEALRPLLDGVPSSAALAQRVGAGNRLQPRCPP